MSEYIIQEETLAYLASAVKEKAGIDKEMTLKNMIDEIYLLETETDIGYVGKGVIFYDYDGTILYTYSVKEARALTELPSLPIHDGITSYGWTHSLEEVNATLKTLYVGATYESETTKLKIDLSINNSTRIGLYFQQSVENGIQINWGDNTTVETVSGTGFVTISHTYSEISQYTIELSTLSGTLSLGYMGDDGSEYNVFGPLSITSSDTDMLIECVYGKNLSSTGGYEFFESTNLKNVIISQGVTTIGKATFIYCDSLNTVILPNTVTIIDDQAFYHCDSLSLIVFPNSVKRLKHSCFGYAKKLVCVILPSSLYLINYAFSYCNYMEEIHFKSLKPPSGFPYLFKDNESCIIYVPAYSLNKYTETYSDFNIRGEPV